MTYSPSLIRIFQEHAQQEPQLLTDTERESIDLILEAQSKMPFHSETQKDFKEYISLKIRERGNTKTETLYEAISLFLGTKQDVLFDSFKKSVPTKLVEHEYYNDYPPALNGTSQKTLYVYFAGVVLRNFPSVSFDETFTQEILERIAKYAHEHILPPADIMMAKAGDASREINRDQILTLFKKFLQAVVDLQEK